MSSTLAKIEKCGLWTVHKDVGWLGPTVGRFPSYSLEQRPQRQAAIRNATTKRHAFCVCFAITNLPIVPGKFWPAREQCPSM
jgi:hypothetical protein